MKSASFSPFQLKLKNIETFLRQPSKSINSNKTANMAINKTITYDLPDELWKEVKEYAGIFPLPANIIHFDKLTWKELEDIIDDTNSPFSHNICDTNIYDLLVNMEDCVYAGYNKYYYDGTEVKEKEKKEWVVKWLKKYYCDEYGLRQYTYAAIKSRKDRGWKVEKKRQDDILDFWNGVSELITNCFEKRDKVKAAAKKKRAAAKAVKETPKGIVTEINKIKSESEKLMKRMKDDQEKLDKLTTKLREQQTKLLKKRSGVL